MRCGAADTLIGNLTVFEMLLYTADLKLPRRMPYKDKVRKVSYIITQLALTTCQHVRIGSTVQRGISGECSSPSRPTMTWTACMHASCARTALSANLARQAASGGVCRWCRALQRLG